MNHVYLVLAVVAEVVATSALAVSHGFTKPVPSLVTVVGYCVAFYLLSLPLRTIPVGVVYAVWSGLGIVLIAAVGAIWLRQPLDLPAVLGLGLILAGVVVVNVFSKTVGH
jgi:small multidrug resistance pump